VGTLGGLGRRRHRSSERATRHAENALLQATQAGSLLASATAEEVGGDYLLISLSRSRDRSAQIRADHDALSGFRSAFLDHESKEFRVTFSMPPNQHLWRNRVRFRNGSAAAANCVARTFIDAC
jgi:hypothetical protein